MRPGRLKAPTLTLLLLYAILFILFSFLSTPKSLAAEQQINRLLSQQECADVDFSSKFGKVRDQGTSGWCYAFATSDLFSYKLGVRISALDTVVIHNEKRELEAAGLTQKQMMARAGWAAHAIIRAKERGVCLENATSSEPVGADLATIIFKIEEARKAGSSESFLGSGWERVFLKISKEEALSIFDNSREEDIIANLSSENCTVEKRVPVNSLDWAQFLNNTGRGHGAPLIPKLNDIISKTPVIINYDMTALLPGNLEQPPRQHFSLIVGRRWNKDNRACEFKIRNSWGRGSTGYRLGIETKDGHQWVGEAFLSRNLFEVLVIK